MSAGDIADQGVERRRARRRRSVYVALFAGALAAIAVAVLSVTNPAEPVFNVPWVAVALAFLAVEAVALHVEIRRETHTVSLSGFALLLGLLTLNPIPLVAARLAGSAIALTVIRRRGGVKLLWNLALFAAETALASAIASAALSSGEPTKAAAWLTLLSAILAAEFFGLVAVPLVIMVFDGEFRPSLFAQVGRGQAISAASAFFGIVVAGAALQSVSLVTFALLPIIGIALLLRIHGQLGKEHADLKRLHGFTTAIAGRDSLDTGLRELASILRTRGAVLLLCQPDGTVKMRAAVEDRQVDGTIRTSRRASPSIDACRVDSTRDDLSAEILEWFGASDGLWVKVLQATDEEAFMLVFDRLGATTVFGDDELALFGSLAKNLGARLSADRLMDRLEFQARIDDLTGLANRNTLERALDHRLNDVSRPGAVMILDLDRFKDVNDSLGHQFGDQLLKVFAQRLQTGVGADDVPARVGGDEFAVLLDDASSKRELAQRVEDLTEHLSQPVTLDGITLDLAVSAGLATWPIDGRTSTDLIRLADIAMYEAKRTHQRWVRYVETIDHASLDRLSLMGQLRDAIRDGQLVIHLQPQVSAKDLSMNGAEALVRWEHPELGMVPPNEFIPLAEHSTVAGELTRFVTDQSLDTVRRLHDEGIDLHCSVNLTSRDLLDRSFPQTVFELLAKHDLPGSCLTFEVTESSFIIDIEGAIDVLEALRDLGCRTSADDFGTGYASLVYLQQLPLDEVKIDRAFIANAASNRGDETIVRSTTRLLQDLGLTVVAEGVEDEPTLNLVRTIGCDSVQGFLVSRPLDTESFLRYAQEHGRRRTDVIVPEIGLEVPLT